MRKNYQHIINIFILITIFLFTLACSSSDSDSQSAKDQDAISEDTTTIEATQIPTDEPTPSSSNKLGKIGDKIDSSGIALIVVGVQTAQSIGIFQAEPGNIFIDVEVMIENSGDKESIPYNPMYFTIKDDTGQEFKTALGSLDPSLKSGELIHGDKARGHISFEVPESSKGFILTYEPLVILGGYEKIRFDLSQNSENPVDLTTESQTNQAILGKIGEKVVSGGIGLTVLAITTPASISNGVFTPDAANKYVDIEVVIENIEGSDEYPYNPLYFKLKDSNGYEYSTAFGSVEPSLKSGTLPKGDLVRGHVTFEVAKDAVGLVVSYEPMVIFGGYETISISLE
jgi:hypothetical protein